MKLFDKIFYGFCGFLFVGISFVLLNLWFKWFPMITIDKYAVLLILALIGIFLLPFMEKIKIGNFLELERLKQEIKEVKIAQYLGEIIRNPIGDLFCYDSDGKHILPDKATADFLKSSKGEIQVNQEVFDLMKTSYKVDSVITSKKIKWREHVFVILNDKKYYINSWSLMADWGASDTYEVINDGDIKLIPTGK